MTETTQRSEGERVYLRPLTLSDVTETYLSWLNDPETNRFLETRRETLEGLKTYVAARVGRRDVFFAGIFEKASGKHIGNVKLEPIDWVARKAVFGILIGNPAYRGKGIGTEATKLIVRHAFESLGLYEVELGVIAENLAACRAYEKAGFKITEIKQGALNYKGMRYTKITMKVSKPS